MIKRTINKCPEYNCSKMILAISLLFLMGTKAMSQPNWTVNPGSYSSNMTLTGAINLNQEESRDGNDMVAAFIDGECRGLAQPVLEGSVNRYIVYLMVYSNDVNGTIQFKVYDASSGNEIDIDVTMEYEVNGIIGSTQNPYIWSSPTLSSEAELISFTVPGQVGDTYMDNTSITLMIPYGMDKTGLVADFTHSGGALVFVNDGLQTSGVSANDFSLPLDYTVQSADEATKKTFTITVIDEQERIANAVNVFSPNNDGINDYWILKNNQTFSNCKFYIFNNIGELIYSSTGYNNDWNGTYKGRQLPIGTYYYLIKCPDCSNCNYTGSISLLR